MAIIEKVSKNETRSGRGRAGSVAFTMTERAGQRLSVVEITAAIAVRTRRAFLFLRTRQKTFALCLLAGSLAGTAHGLSFFTYTALGWLFKCLARLHFAEESLPLHLLLQDPQGLLNIVVTDENLQSFSLPMLASPCEITIDHNQTSV
ncbi:hypothetical protein DEV91_102236 [Phyllobacterium brassicacearum]|nr:hypothetical protein DEV91_102236 [Phyllobacterium brassicacearum]